MQLIVQTPLTEVGGEASVVNGDAGRMVWS